MTLRSAYPTAALVALLSLGCTTYPPARTSPQGSVIGASVTMKGRFGIGSYSAKYATFVLLDASQTGYRGSTFRSNYERDGYVYLFNARPGRYALVFAGRKLEPLFGVGSEDEKTENTENFYLPEDLIGKTIVTVGEGDWAFVGDIFLGWGDWDSADPVQRYYYSTLAPGHDKLNITQRNFGGGEHAPGVLKSLDQQPGALQGFVESSLEISGSDWTPGLAETTSAGSGSGSEQ